MTDETPLKIEIPPEDGAETPVVEAPPLVPERPSRNTSGQVKNAAGKAGEQLAGAAKKAWDSEARRKATRGAAAVAAKGSQMVQDKVVKTAEEQARERAAAVRTRMQETDWKTEAQTGTAKALKWLSERFAAMAARFTPAKEPPPPAAPAPPADTEEPAQDA